MSIQNMQGRSYEMFLFPLINYNLSLKGAMIKLKVPLCC